jgi:hypothetical protein
MMETSSSTTSTITNVTSTIEIDLSIPVSFKKLRIPKLDDFIAMYFKSYEYEMLKKMWSHLGTGDLEATSL